MLLVFVLMNSTCTHLSRLKYMHVESGKYEQRPLQNEEMQTDEYSKICNKHPLSWKAFFHNVSQPTKENTLKFAISIHFLGKHSFTMLASPPRKLRVKLLRYFYYTTLSSFKRDKLYDIILLGCMWQFLI
jgi:hypothetical protein